MSCRWMSVGMHCRNEVFVFGDLEIIVRLCAGRKIHLVVKLKYGRKSQHSLTCKPGQIIRGQGMQQITHNPLPTGPASNSIPWSYPNVGDNPTLATQSHIAQGGRILD